MTSRLDSLKIFLQQDPGDSFTRYAIALEYIKEKNYEESIKNLQEILDNDQDYLAAYQQLGHILALTNQKEKAKEIYKKGVIVARKLNEKHTESKMQESLEELS